VLVESPVYSLRSAGESKVYAASFDTKMPERVEPTEGVASSAKEPMAYMEMKDRVNQFDLFPMRLENAYR
jgi:hypothetical protein